MNPNSFAHKQNQQLPNGQPAAPAPANANANNGPAQNQQPQQTAANAAQGPQTTGADMNGPPFGSSLMGEEFSLGLDFPMNEDALENFDFDSFLNQDGGDGLDFGNFAFDPIEAGMDGPN